MITPIPNKSYTLLIALFTLASLLFLGTGLLLFHLRFGWSLTDLESVFVGNETRMQISTDQLLKVSVPHTISIGLFTFILGHFLMFAETATFKIRQILACGLIASGLINANIGWMIILAPNYLAITKLISFLIFQFFFISTAWMILKSFLTTPQSSAAALSKKD